MFDEQFVCFSPEAGAPSLVGAPILLDRAEPAGVRIAADNLADDFNRVTQQGTSPVQAVSANDSQQTRYPQTVIIVGTIENSSILRCLENDGLVSLDDIRGNWESYVTTVIRNPPSLPGCEAALVIAGSDKRGAIFGIYSLSEQIGVSPWYWWADVPPTLHPDIYALPVRTRNGEPSIRYRGIFINDEAPALTGWVRDTFGTYGVDFYKKVFELLLRLKANFMWPAMWPGYPNPGAVFFLDDDGANQRLADEYGIVMSTSHHEPMQRATTEWFLDNPDGSWDWIANKSKIVDFFRHGAARAKGCETYFTLGMRGEYDKKMKTDDPAAVVKDVIASQRKIFGDVYGKEDRVCQLLALYKEVLELFETGRLAVPDDVTLLFADDNHGTIRRLPTKGEAKRKGGAGIYYHFEYVGTPRSYKWINSNSLGKVWHQLREAHDRHARQIWIFNVGDIKPLEIPITFGLSLAWNIDSIDPEGFDLFYQRMAEREFGSTDSLVSLDKKDVAVSWNDYDRLASLRKHEMIERDTFSLLHYNEAETVLQHWKSTLESAQSIYDALSVDDPRRPSVFQLILHPAKASYIYVALRIAQAKNRLYARQRRNSANLLAKQVLDLFDQDYTLQEEFHALLGGKWNQMLRQTHYGYEDTWHAPSRDMIEGICYVQRRQDSNPIVGQMGVAVEDHEGVRPGRINEESERTHPSRRDLVPGVTFRPFTRYDAVHTRWFEVFTRGSLTIHWSASVPYEWMTLSCTEGVLDPDGNDAHVEVSVDWVRVPADFNAEVLVTLRSEEGDFEHLHMPINGRQVPETFRDGFVEASGYVSIPAPAVSPSSPLVRPYQHLPSMGRELQGSVALLSYGGAALDMDSIPWLSYSVYTFTKTTTTKLQLIFAMTLDVDPADPLSYDVQVDGSEIQMHNLLEKESGVGTNLAESAQVEGWFDAAQDGVWKRSVEWAQPLLPGAHTIRVRLRQTNIVLEKVIVDLGGIMDSYLGPPASVWR